MVILMQSIGIDVFFSNLFLRNLRINNDEVVMVLSRLVMSFLGCFNWNLVVLIGI